VTVLRSKDGDLKRKPMYHKDEIIPFIPQVQERATGFNLLDDDNTVVMRVRFLYAPLSEPSSEEEESESEEDDVHEYEKEKIREDMKQNYRHTNAEPQQSTGMQATTTRGTLSRDDQAKSEHPHTYSQEKTAFEQFAEQRRQRLSNVIDEELLDSKPVKKSKKDSLSFPGYWSTIKKRNTPSNEQDQSNVWDHLGTGLPPMDRNCHVIHEGESERQNDLHICLSQMRGLLISR
jgi:hypothetical protein